MPIYRKELELSSRQSFKEKFQIGDWVKAYPCSNKDGAFTVFDTPVEGIVTGARYKKEFDREWEPSDYGVGSYAYTIIGDESFLCIEIKVCWTGKPYWAFPQHITKIPSRGKLPWAWNSKDEKE